MFVVPSLGPKPYKAERMPGRSRPQAARVGKMKDTEYNPRKLVPRYSRPSNDEDKRRNEPPAAPSVLNPKTEAKAPSDTGARACRSPESGQGGA